MARKEDEPNGTATAPLPDSAPDQPADNGKLKPVFKVGPIATGKGESVAGCVWANEYAAPDGCKYTVHSIQMELSYYHEGDRAWKPSRTIRANQLAAVEYVLRMCGDFCFHARDPQNDLSI